MEEHPVIAIIDERLQELKAEIQHPIQIIPIRPFKAWDEEDRELEVVGVVHNGDDLQFVAIVERTGECFPSMLDVVYRTPAPREPSEKEGTA
jgi:hypothetical protein